MPLPQLRLDYRGYWVGQIPIGDATGGAVKHVGGDFNYTARDAGRGKTMGKTRTRLQQNGMSTSEEPVNMGDLKKIR